MKPFRMMGLLLFGATAPVLAATFSDRLTEENLAAVRAGARELRMQARPEPEGAGYQDVRTVLHAHSGLSHDSRGTEEQIVAAAKKAQVRAVFMSEHPTPDRKWATAGLRGEKEGVLFVPGAELSDGLLIWRSEGQDWTPQMKASEVLEKLAGSRAVTFVAHPEERKDDAAWNLPAFHGMEIYNTHADAEDSGYEKLLESFRKESPFRLLGVLSLLKKYPREAFAAVFDEQTEILGRWDRLNAAFLSGENAGNRRVVGIAGNDSHQNVGISVEPGEGGLVIKDALGRVIGKPGKKGGGLQLGGGGGAPLIAHTFDPYDVSFGYVSTHLLLEQGAKVTEDSLFDALLRGRAYVAFDWMADPSGFRFTAEHAGKTSPMGSDVPLAEKPTLAARTTLPATLRLLRNGVEIRRVEGTEFTVELQEPGVYRAEAWLEVAGEQRPWIYSNPLYVK